MHTSEGGPVYNPNDCERLVTMVEYPKPLKKGMRLRSRDLREGGRTIELLEKLSPQEMRELGRVDETWRVQRVDPTTGALAGPKTLVTRLGLRERFEVLS